MGSRKTSALAEVNAYIGAWARAQAMPPFVDPTVTFTGENRFTLRALAADGGGGRAPMTIAGSIIAADGIGSLHVDFASVREVAVEGRQLDRLLDRVFDPARLGVDVRASFPLPARIREMHVERSQLVIKQ